MNSSQSFQITAASNHKSDKLKIAVVILNWNGKKLLEEFLPSIIKFSAEAQVYVADNASSDDSVSLITGLFPSVKIIQNSKNYGFAQGYNEALRSVDEEIYALVNSDIEVTENWLQPVVRLFGSEPETAIIQPKILDYKRKTHFEYAGAAGGFIDKYGFPYCRGRLFQTIEEDHNQYDNNAEIFWASGACFFIRRDVFRTLGGFDAHYFAHQEEIDLCWRAFNIGHKVKFCFESVVYHVGGATLDSQDPKKTYLNFRNSLFMMVKNLPSKNMFWILFIRMVLDGFAGIRFMAQGKSKHFGAVVKAHGSFYRSFRKYYKKRQEFTQRKDYFHIKSAAFQYFIERKRKFSDLI